MQPAVRTSVLSAAVVAAAATLLSPGAARAAGVTGGDLLILRAGDGVTTGSAAGVFIDEYTTAGAFVRSFAVPGTGASALTVGLGTTTEGGLNLSVDGNYVVFAGYRKDAGSTSGGAGDAASTTARVIGRLTLADGTVDTSTVIKTTADGGADLFSASSVRGVASTDGQHFWVSGAANPAASGGVVYTDSLGPSAVSTLVNSNNYRGITIANGDVYASRASSIHKFAGLPTASLAPTTVETKGSGQNYEAVAFLDLSPTIPGVDTFYAPNGSNIEKWCLDSTGTTWSQVGSIPTNQTANALYLTAGKPTVNGTTGEISVPLFFTTTSTTAGASVLSIATDVSLFGAAPTGSGSLLATAGTGTNFRGIALTALPTITHTPGDVNGDGFVNSGDINAFIYALSNDATAFAAQYPSGVYMNADVNETNHAGDGFVNAADINPFIAILSGTGEPGIAAALAAVPEPTGLGLLGAGALGMLARRKRA